ncbi:MAG: LysR family transcriptional regulator [Actinomycetota bacterium]|nr:LysR family transcriptional regulator [Actinomycetota bacterium]
MTFGQLRTFVEVAHQGSIRAAAAVLAVTEPSVSAAISSLQGELGVALVERQGRGIRLTPAGEELARYAAQILGLRDEAGRRIREKAGQSAQLRISAVTTAGEYLLAPILKLFRSRHRQVQLWMEVGNQASLFESLTSHQAEIGIGGRPPRNGDISGEPFLDNRLVVVASTEHPFARKGWFDPSELSGETWLLRESGSGTRHSTEEFFNESGIESAQVMTLGSNGAVKQAAVLGLGITLISSHAVAVELASGALVQLRVKGTPLKRSWHVLYRSRTSLTPSGTEFLKLLRSPASRKAIKEWFGPGARFGTEEAP